MGGMATWFGWGNDSADSQELPCIFPLNVTQNAFIEIDAINLFQKILTDVVERTHGLSEEQSELLWDNCIQSEASHGLISLLARAMTYRKDLFLVYNPALSVLRIADSTETEQIRQDYIKSGKSDVGVYVSFRHYLKADLIKLYSALEYITVSALHKSMNLSGAIQLKMNDMRGSTGMNDSAGIIAQAKLVAKSLSNGKDVLLDAKDAIENAVPDLTAVQASIEYLSSKKSFYLGLPAGYITGEQTGGIGSTGEADTKAVERGLKNFYHSILKPVLEVVFDVETSYKSQDFRQIDQAMNALKTFALVDESLISLENKQLVINKLLDLPEDEVGDTEGSEVLTPEQIAINNTNDQI